MNIATKRSYRAHLIATISLCLLLFFQPSSVEASFVPKTLFFLHLQETPINFSLQNSPNTPKNKIQQLSDFRNSTINNDGLMNNHKSSNLFSKTTMRQNGMIAILVIFFIGIIIIWHVRLKKEIKQRKIFEQKLEETQKLGKRSQERIKILENDNKALKQEMAEYLASEKQFSRNQKMKTIGLMAGGIAHKLNNILTSIISYPDLILLKLPENDGLRPLVKEIKASGRRAEEVMTDLLNITGGTAHNRIITSLNSIIIGYINSPEHEIVIKHYEEISFKTELAPDLPNISCSTDHIKKCLVTLVNNAAETIDKDGNVLISTTLLEEQNARQLHKSLDDKDYIVLSIQDSGPEIEDHYIDHIFEPFYIKRVMGRQVSSGLELTIVWNIVHDHEGEIIVSSSKKGTTFTIYLPSSRKNITETTEQIPQEELVGNREKILVVDDDQLQRNMICELLRNLNYEPFAVESGEQSIGFLCDNSVDLVLIDMFMEPGLNGRETYEQLIEINSEQKAIVISGYNTDNDDNDIKEMMKLGAELYLKKPFTLEELGVAVKESLASTS